MVAALRHHIHSLHRNLLALLDSSSGVLLVGMHGGVIYNKVNEPIPRGYDVVTEFKTGNWLIRRGEAESYRSRPSIPKDSCIEVPKTVNFQGMTYKVDEIEKNAFADHAVLKWLVFPDTQFM